MSDSDIKRQIGGLYREGFDGVRTLVIGEPSTAFTDYMLGKRRAGAEGSVSDFNSRIAKVGTSSQSISKVNDIVVVINDIAPEVIYALDLSAHDMLFSRPDKFRLIGRADVSDSERVWLFTPVDSGLGGRTIGRIRYRRKVVPMRHQEDWFRERVKEHLADAFQGSPFEKRKQIRAMAMFLKKLSDRKLIGSNERGIYFRDTEKYKWRSVHVGLFVKKLKSLFNLGRGANEGLNALFGEKGIEKCSANPSILSPTNPLLREIESL